MTEKKNPIGDCMELFRRHGGGMFPALCIALGTALLCCVFDPGAVTLMLAVALVVTVVLQHMKDTPEE